MNQEPNPTDQPPEKKPTEEALATLQADRQQRAQSCGEAIDKALREHRCVLYAPIGVTEDGRIVAPHVKVQPLD